MANHSLQLRLTQKLALAPQLQQAIRLLQLNRIELRDYIQEAIDSNPILEREDDTDEVDTPDSEQDSAEKEEFQDSSEPEFRESDDYDWQSETGGDTWTGQTAYTGDYLEPQIEDQSAGSLREHLLWQVNLGQFTEDDAAIATSIIFGLDDDGFLYIVDRIKDIIIRGGENISCSEVEEAMYAHPHIAEVAVFSLPDERLGEIVGAAVSVRADCDLDAQQVKEFLADRLAAFKIPVHLEIQSDNLPRIASGKIFKKQIRSDVIKRLGL